MARHRNVRTLHYDDEYDDGEVYGRSFEDDMAFSPSTAGFIYRRGNDTSQATLGQFLESEGDAQQQQPQASAAEASDAATAFAEPNHPDISALSLDEKTQLHSAMDHIRGALGENFSEPTAEHLLIGHGYDGERVLDMLLSGNVRLVVPPVSTAAPSSQTSSTLIPPRVVSSQNSRHSSPAPSSATSSKGGSRAASPGNTCSDTRSTSPYTPVPEDTPGAEPVVVKRRGPAVDIAAEYAKRQAGKELINMVVVGHVDAGKSTLMGHLLVQLGNVGKKIMHKYESESKKVGKGSFAYAWVLDETGEERSRGITMDVGITQFETDAKVVTLLDAPGHRDFIPNTITGAAQADVALLVIDASPGGFESGFESGGQTREHSLLLRSLGVQQVAVVVNKLDMVEWSSARFEEITTKVKSFLRQAGFKEGDVTYIPCSGLQGENLAKRSTCDELKSWYGSQCLLEAIDSFKIAERAIQKPFRMFVSDVFKGMGAGFCVSGKIESGAVQTSDRINIMPACESGSCKAITLHDESVQWACAGDYTTLTVTGADMTNVSVGAVLCNPSHPVPVISRFRAHIVIFNVEVPITTGYQVLLHYQTVSEPAIIKKLVSQLGKNGVVTKRKPRCLPKNTKALVEIHVARPVCLELYKDYKELGRFMLRSGNATIAAGVVEEILGM